MLTRAFGRDERPFVLNMAGWREVEKVCDAGLGVLAARLAPLVQLIEADPDKLPGGMIGAVAQGWLGSARIDDVREPILQGLIGGGMTPTEAGILVRTVFDTERAPMLTFARLAFLILQQALIGLEDEPLGETTAPRTAKPPRRSRTAKPASPTSSAPPR